MSSRRTTTRALRLAGTLLVAGMLAACLEVRDDEADAGGDGCTMCHELDVTSHGHAVHRSDAGTWGGVGLSCDDCHVIPTEWFAEGHLNATVEVVFADGGLATAGGAEPSYDGARCSGVYCHGGTLTGGVNTEPEWRDTDPVMCGDCHGIPPLDPHPDNSECATCHADAYLDGGLDTAVHLNGAVDFGSSDGGV